MKCRDFNSISMGIYAKLSLVHQFSVLLLKSIYFTFNGCVFFRFWDGICLFVFFFHQETIVSAYVDRSLFDTVTHIYNAMIFDCADKYNA